MDMDHLIGQRFSLISKSEIRYVGILHEINPEQSTIALEDVFSYGTEGRKVDSFIPASQQKFEYIVFRGNDVKDIKIVEADKEPKQPSPPNFPNDPAILNSSRPGPSQGPPQIRGESPFPPPGHPPQHQFPGYYPPPQYGRGFPPPPPGGFGPGPGPGFQGYGPPPPPPGYFPPPGQGFPQGPHQFHAPPPPIGPPGQRPPPPQAPPQQPLQAPGAPPGLQPTSELPVDNKAGSKQPSTGTTPVPAAPAQATSTDPKPSQPPTGAPAATLPPTAPRGAPTQPKGNKVTPAVPLTVNQKSFTPPVPTTAEVVANGASKPAPKPVPTQAAMDEATLKAKEAVAAALAKLPQASAQPKPVPTAASIDALSKKVSEMGPSNNGTQRGRGSYRGRGPYPRTGSGGHQARKIEIPKSDYDFESANAKFNKEDLIKEAIASGSPVAEAADDDANGPTADPEPEGLKRKDSIPLNTGKGYNKASSFFDNISSEAKDREESQDAKHNARQMRGEEFKKNVETFGQGNVDGGYRGRGRGGFGRGRQYGGTYRGGYSRGFGGGYRGKGRGGGQTPSQTSGQPPPTQTPVAQS